MKQGTQARRFLTVAAALAALPSTYSYAATAVWDGTISGVWGATSGADSNWTGGAGTNGRPQANDSLQFAGSTTTTTTNDLAANTKFNGITFNAGASTFTLGGNDIDLHGNMTNSSSVAQIVDFHMRLTGNRSISAGSTTSTPITLNGNISESSAGFNLTKTNAGLLILSGTNSYTGMTSVLGGVVRLSGGNNRLATSSNVNIQNGGSAAATGTLDLFGNNQSISALTSSVAGTGAFIGSINNSAASTTSTLTVTGTSTFDGILANGTGTLALTKSTGGSLTLNRAQTYTGATQVTGGTLSLASTGSLAALSAVGVSGTGTLAGTGTANGTVTVGSGGTLSPGNSPGTLNVGGLTLNDGGEYNWQVLDASGAAGTGYDSINATGTLNLAGLSTGGFDINLWSLASIGPDVNGNAANFNSNSPYSWTLVATNSAISGYSAAMFDIITSASNGTSGFANTTAGTFSTALSGDNTDLLLTYTPVPEPATLGLLGLAGLAMRRRR